MAIYIVTGASSGMGREFVLQLGAKREADEIWAIARREERLRELSESCETKVRPIAADLEKAEDIARIKSMLEAERPEVKILVNCAGFAKFGAFGTIAPEEEMAMIDLDVKALVLMTQAVVPFMPQGGHVLQVASTAAFQPLPEMNVYAASKAFVLSYARALNVELQTRGISVTAVCPGWTKTEFFDVAEKNADKNAVHSSPFMAEPQKVVSAAIKAAERERELSVYGITNKAHLFFAKILPAGFVMNAWGWMK